MTVLLRIETKVKALTPIAHLGGGTSTRKINLSLANKIPFVTNDGEVVEIPAVSGNGFRGQLRDALACVVAEAVGEPLDKRVFHIMFSGGKLDKNETGGGGKGKKKKQVARVDELRGVYENPFLELFGGALDLASVRGRLRVGWIVPLTPETSVTLPDNYFTWAAVKRDALPPAEGLTRWDIMHTRRDDLKDPHLGGRFLHPGEEVVLSDEGFTKREMAMRRKEGKDTNLDDQKEGTRGMVYHLEVIPAGAVMRGTLHVVNASEAAAGALFAALRRFSMDGACLGGKLGSGYGEVSMKARLMDTGEDVFTLEAGDFRLEERFGPMEEAFREWLASVTLDGLRRTLSVKSDGQEQAAA